MQLFSELLGRARIKPGYSLLPRLMAIQLGLEEWPISHSVAHGEKPVKTTELKLGGGGSPVPLLQ